MSTNYCEIAPGVSIAQDIASGDSDGALDTTVTWLLFVLRGSGSFIETDRIQLTEEQALKMLDDGGWHSELICKETRAFRLSKKSVDVVKVNDVKLLRSLVFRELDALTVFGNTPDEKLKRVGIFEEVSRLRDLYSKLEKFV
jgi:hypothetical protein